MLLNAGFLDWQDSTRPNAGHQFMNFYVMHINNPYDVLQGAAPNLTEVRRCRAISLPLHLTHRWQ